MSYENFVDIGTVEDEGNLKLSYHYDGFVQFSGKSIYSGKDREGNIRGIGIQSQSLSHPIVGPSISISFNDVLGFKFEDKMKNGFLELPFGLSLNNMKTINVLEFFVFPAQFEENIVNSPNGREWAILNHPTLGMNQVAILRPPITHEKQFLIGVMGRVVRNEDQVGPMFSVQGPSGNLRYIDGHKYGDAIGCVYPATDEIIGRLLKYVKTNGVNIPKSKE